MASIHEQLAARGRRSLIAEGKFPRDVIDAAARMMEEGGGDVIAFAYSGWAQCALPHKRLPAGQVWTVDSSVMRLEVVPGRRPSGRDGTGPNEAVSVPFGAYARLIILYLITEGIRTGQREISLGSSWRSWLDRLGVSWGGATGQAVREQADLIARCSLAFYAMGEGQAGLVNRPLVDRALFLDTGDGPQGNLSLDTAHLSETFFEQIMRNPVPLNYEAVRALADKSPALDCYLFLAYRLPSLTAPRLVTWDALKAQFGVGVRHVHHFKPNFKRALELATAVYPQAKIEERPNGLLLKPSKPPVSATIVPIRSLSKS